MNDTSRRLPRPLWGLAMTDVVDGLRLSSDSLCHCEEAKPTWQSVFLQAVIFRKEARTAAKGLAQRPLRGLARTTKSDAAPLVFSVVI